ncbi:MAG: hypothetical protein SFV81_25865 [Pirellulaceae bacterium]|nr:hypothetical protein [Pirellulaceae bacterium]
MKLNIKKHPFAFAWFCALIVASNTYGQIPSIQLSAVSRPVGQAASTFPMRVSEGEQLDEVDRLVFSHPGIVSTLQTTAPRLLETEPQPQYGQFSVAIAPEVPPGIYEVRAKGRFGLSNPRAFLVTQSPVQFIEAEHTKPEAAIDLSLQQVTVDRAYPQRRNYYHVALTENDRLYVCAHARRLDSRALVALALLDPKGHEVARGRAIGEYPAELVFKVPAAGTYTLVAYDFLYQGGEGFAFALQASVDPASTSTAPENELKKLCATGGQLLSVVKRDTTTDGLKPLVADPAATSALWLTPPANPPAPASERTVPFTESGRFPSNAPSLNFDFKANAGQVLWVEVNSSKLDQLTDPRVIIYKVNRDSAGKETLQQLAEQDDAATLGPVGMKLRMRDPYLQFTAPENATYRILLADNATGARPAEALNFVLTVREPQPSFELLAYQPFPSKDPVQSKNWATNLMRGGTEAIHVLVTRRDGFGDAIELNVDGLPAGVTCEKAMVPAGVNEAMLVLRAAEDAADWVGNIKVVGRSLGANPQERVAMAGTTLRGTTPTRNTIESRLAANLTLRVNGLDTAPLMVALGDAQTLEMSRGGKLPFPVKVTRRAGGAGKCTLRPQNLPPKVTLGEIAVEGDKSEATAELTIAPDAAVGEYTFWMQNETPIKWRPNPQTLADAEAYAAKIKTASEDPAQAAEKPKLDAALKAANERVEQLKKSTAERDVTVYFPTTPLRIRIVDSPVRPLPIAPLTGAAGSEQTVELKIERLFGFADAVDLSLAGKTSIEGLEVPNVQIPAGMDTAKIVIKIPAGATPATVNIPIKMDCKFNGHALSQTLTVGLTIAAAVAAQ